MSVFYMDEENKALGKECVHVGIFILNRKNNKKLIVTRSRYANTVRVEGSVCSYIHRSVCE